ncbi:MAG: large-conductance mechanosensitive channel protein MscL [Alphaproteobacteria bacterium]|nr:large-conductance mechanosensitive channel protein MscL [Alphaproteobacteria bacterium]
MLKNVLKEFKTFALKGNVLDMAVGIIIGASFGKIVDSLVKDVMMPPLGMLLGKVDFSSLKIPLGAEPDAATINYGIFLNNVISFVIVAFAVFLLVKAINTVRAKMERAEAKAAAEAAPTEKECPYCCTKIPVGAKRCPHCTSELKK